MFTKTKTEIAILKKKKKSKKTQREYERVNERIMIWDRSENKREIRSKVWPLSDLYVRSLHIGIWINAYQFNVSHLSINSIQKIHKWLPSLVCPT